MSKDVLKTIYAKNKIPIIIMGAKAVEESRRLCLKGYEICVIPGNIDDYKKKISTQSTNLVMKHKIIAQIIPQIAYFRELDMPCIEDKGKGQGFEILEKMVKE
jgi:hypothetical protein